ncbi:unnamed protein product [Amaranthus hypochondriacus]
MLVERILCGGRQYLVGVVQCGVMVFKIRLWGFWVFQFWADLFCSGNSKPRGAEEINGILSNSMEAVGMVVWLFLEFEDWCFDLVLAFLSTMAFGAGPFGVRLIGDASVWRWRGFV